MKFPKPLPTLCLTISAILFSQIAAAQQIKAADVHPKDYPNVVAVKNMGDKLKTATDGRLEIKTFPGGVLG
ncbi:TRAP transporter substrate-binding protein, partial [Yersinia enterocolitica]